MALALARTPLETARVTSRWNAKRSLFMVSAPYKSTDTLVSDLCLAAGRLLAQQWSRETGHDLAQLRDRKDFEVFVAWLRDRLEDQVETIAAQVEAALEAKGQLDKAVGRNTSLALLDTLQEIREQAAALIAPRFIARRRSGTAWPTMGATLSLWLIAWRRQRPRPARMQLWPTRYARLRGR